MRLNDAKVLVTGGGSGIGLATARALKGRGAQVAISGRRADVLARAAKDIGATPVIADVTDEASVARLVETVARELGGYNVLINNAGIGS
jgi:3-oxoacyl-[acyl-carrier protein] reductase